MRLNVLLGLIFCNLIWSLNPVMGKVLLTHFSPIQSAWWRYTTAFFTAGVLMLFVRKLRKRWPKPSKKQSIGILAIAVLTFCLGPMTLMLGLDSSRATDSALIVAMEPLMTLLLGWVFLSERITRGHALCFGIALFGFVLLTGIRSDSASGIVNAHLIGNLLMLLAVAGDASFSIIGRALVSKGRKGAALPSLQVYLLSLGIGTVFLTAALLITQEDVLGGSLPWTPKLWLAILWIGPVATGLGYLFWIWALESTNAGSLALTLFVQPVLGAISAWLFLDESLSLVQWIGGAMILISIVGYWRASTRWSAKSPSKNSPKNTNATPLPGI